MKELREELRIKPPVIGAYVPRRGDLCVARFSADKLWYRARVEAIKGKKVDILYIDFGNVISSQLIIKDGWKELRLVNYSQSLFITISL